MPEPPILHCIIARKLSNGGIGRSRVVSLSTAYLALKSGAFFVLGPDPDDEVKLAAWERDQQALNRPRWHQ